MADRVLPGPVDSSARISEAVSVHTSKIYDSCRDKDCIEDLRVYPTLTAQTYIDSALSVRPRRAELLYVDTAVEPLYFNRGYYTIDATYYYRVNCEAYPGGGAISGLAVFTKRVILYGGEGEVKIFSSAGAPGDVLGQPRALVEAVDPIILNTKLADAGAVEKDVTPEQIPAFILAEFGEDLVFGDGQRQLLASLGQFSIIRLERDTQLLLPSYSYCFPDKECVGTAPDEDPCTLFSRIPFPVDEFYPPDLAAEEAAAADA